MISIHPQILHDMCLCWLLAVVLPHLTVFSDITSWEDEAGKNLKMSPVCRCQNLELIVVHSDIFFLLFFLFMPGRLQDRKL